MWTISLLDLESWFTIGPCDDTINVWGNPPPVPDMPGIPRVKPPVVLIVSENIMFQSKFKWSRSSPPVLISRKQICLLILSPDESSVQGWYVGAYSKISQRSRMIAWKIYFFSFLFDKHLTKKRVSIRNPVFVTREENYFAINISFIDSINPVKSIFISFLINLNILTFPSLEGIQTFEIQVLGIHF